MLTVSVSRDDSLELFTSVTMWRYNRFVQRIRGGIFFRPRATTQSVPSLGHSAWRVFYHNNYADMPGQVCASAVWLWTFRRLQKRKSRYLPFSAARRKLSYWVKDFGVGYKQNLWFSSCVYRFGLKIRNKLINVCLENPKSSFFPKLLSFPVPSRCKRSLLLCWKPLTYCWC